MSLFIAISSIGASAGLVLGGALTELASWRWSLLINVPVGLVVASIIGRLVAETPRARARLDVAGALTATAASTALVYAFVVAADHGWNTPGTLLALLVAAITGTAFFVIQGRTRQPLLNLELLRDTKRDGGLMVMALIVGMHFATLFLVVQYFQRVLGFGPLLAGTAYLPLTAMVFMITHFVPSLLQRFAARALLATGSIIVAVSLVLFARIDASGSYRTSVLPALVLHSIGIALVFAPGTVAVMDGV
ncbi:MFS transporter [Roseomonas sp. E05]|uniref:MFS transporter n=1 Tax=Roseomonas sp. E05 TaxID=3046310 RepID=UPI0038D09F45